MKKIIKFFLVVIVLFGIIKVFGKPGNQKQSEETQPLQLQQKQHLQQLQNQNKKQKKKHQKMIQKKKRYLKHAQSINRLY